jgi:hypothetical protein
LFLCVSKGAAAPLHPVLVICYCLLFAVIRSIKAISSRSLRVAQLTLFNVFSVASVA